MDWKCGNPAGILQHTPDVASWYMVKVSHMMAEQRSWGVAISNVFSCLGRYLDCNAAGEDSNESTG